MSRNYPVTVASCNWTSCICGHQSPSAPPSFSQIACNKRKLVQTKYVVLGEKTLGILFILLLHAWVRVQANILPHYCFHNKGTGILRKMWLLQNRGKPRQSSAVARIRGEPTLSSAVTGILGKPQTNFYSF